MLISVLCLTGWRLWAGMALGCVLWGLFCWPVGEGLAIRLVTYSDDSRRFVADLPHIYWTPDVLAAGFLAGMCLLGWRGWAVVLLCAPMLALAGMMGRWLWLDEYLIDAVVVAGYLGLAASAVWLRAADAR